MKRVYVCIGEPQKFRIFCDIDGSYVLDNATSAQVSEYFVGIATRRAIAAAEDLISKAQEDGPSSEPRRLH